MAQPKIVEHYFEDGFEIIHDNNGNVLMKGPMDRGFRQVPMPDHSAEDRCMHWCDPIPDFEF